MVAVAEGLLSCVLRVSCQSQTVSTYGGRFFSPPFFFVPRREAEYGSGSSGNLEGDTGCDAVYCAVQISKCNMKLRGFNFNTCGSDECSAFQQLIIRLSLYSNRVDRFISCKYIIAFNKITISAAVTVVIWSGFEIKFRYHNE